MTANNDAQIIANLVILDRAAEKHKAALLLEGKTDGRLYKKVLDPSCCRTFAAGNRAVAEIALDILQKHGTKGVLALVDADTDYLTGKKPSNKDLLITHTRDVEGLVFQSDALRDVLIEFDLEDAFGPKPEIAAINAAVPLAIVKFIADREKSKVRTSELEFHTFIDPLDLTCDGTKLCKQMEALTEGKGVSADVYAGELNKILASMSDPFQVARGHDVTAVLAWAIVSRKGVKRKAGGLITGELIGSYMRAAYSPDAFVKCDLFKRLQQWESENVPYRLLRR